MRTIKIKLYRVFITIILVIVFNSIIFAQEGSTTASIEGKVLDEQDSVIGGAKIIAKRIGSTFEREVVSQENGMFSLINLPPGLYTIFIQAEAFNKETASIELELGTKKIIYIKLKIDSIRNEI